MSMTDNRTHAEGLGGQWAVLLGGDPRAIFDQVVATVLHAGGTRGAWKHVNNRGIERVMMAWPADQPVRASVVMQGEEGKNLKPVTAAPLLEGLPNDLMVEDVHPWKSGVEGNVAVTMTEGRNPLWFYCPTYFRDAEELTPGVTHSFVLGGLAYSLRRALVDDMTITQGPYFEAHAEKWLAENPGKERTDVPPLKISMAGKKIIMPGRVFGEYQVRTRVERVEACKLDKLDIAVLYVAFEFDDRPALHLPIYVPKPMLKDYEPAEGDEIEAYVWLQGRIIDFDPNEAAPDSAEPKHAVPEGVVAQDGKKKK